MSEQLASGQLKKHHHHQHHRPFDQQVVVVGQCEWVCWAWIHWRIFYLLSEWRWIGKEREKKKENFKLHSIVSQSQADSIVVVTAAAVAVDIFKVGRVWLLRVGANLYQSKKKKKKKKREKSLGEKKVYLVKMLILLWPWLNTGRWFIVEHLFVFSVCFNELKTMMRSDEDKGKCSLSLYNNNNNNSNASSFLLVMLHFLSLCSADSKKKFPAGISWNQQQRQQQQEAVSKEKQRKSVSLVAPQVDRCLSGRVWCERLLWLLLHFFSPLLMLLLCYCCCCCCFTHLSFTRECTFSPFALEKKLIRWAREKPLFPFLRPMLLLLQCYPKAATLSRSSLISDRRWRKVFSAHTPLMLAHQHQQLKPLACCRRKA